MKERPIIFSAEMVLAILRKDKTNTRRIWKPKLEEIGESFTTHVYEVGDLLYVKEAWRTLKIWNDRTPSKLPPGVPILYEADNETKFKPQLHYGGRYRHARFMPRWASRITLEIEAVRVERVQDITEADAMAEGIMAFDFPVPQDPPDKFEKRYGLKCYFPKTEPRASLAFRNLWNTIHAFDGPHGWAANPWVRVLQFKEVAR